MSEHVSVICRQVPSKDVVSELKVWISIDIHHDCVSFTYSAKTLSLRHLLMQTSPCELRVLLFGSLKSDDGSEREEKLHERYGRNDPDCPQIFETFAVDGRRRPWWGWHGSSQEYTLPHVANRGHWVAQSAGGFWCFTVDHARLVLLEQSVFPPENYVQGHPIPIQKIPRCHWLLHMLVASCK